MPAIATNKLSKVYKNGRGIHGIDLKVEKGDVFGFIGPNGAGKSTLIRTLLGLMAPTGGEAFLMGQRVGIDRPENLKNVGYLPSEAIFYKGMTVQDILTYAARLRGQDCAKKAAELVALLDIDGRQRADTLSLGNRKKVSIICALQHQPDLYLLDEPTSGLDPLVQRTFWQYMTEENKRGATVFASSHVLSEVQRHCRNVGVIREGLLVVSDQTEHLTHTQRRKVMVEGAVDLEGLVGVYDLVTWEGHTSFVYQGEMPPLLERLHRGQVHSLSITEMDLEEVFEQYYEGGQP